MITNGFAYVAVLMLMSAVLVTLQAHAKGALAKFFKYVPAVVLCYLFAMLLCTLNVWNLEATRPAYSSLENNVTFAMIFTMLLHCDIRKIIKLGPRMLVGFFSATLTIMIGFIFAFLIMKRYIGPDAWTKADVTRLNEVSNRLAAAAGADLSAAGPTYTWPGRGTAV